MDVASRAKKRLIIATGVALVIVVTAIGVRQLLPDGDTTEPVSADVPERELSATEVTNHFLDALTAGDAASAGSLTDNTSGATAELAALWQGLSPTSATADRTGLVEPAADAATAEQPYTLTWELGAGRAWTYDSSLRLVKNSDGWRVHWQPSLVHPVLAPGQRLVVRDRSGQPAVVDRDGAPLLTWNGSEPSAADPAVAPLLLPAMGRVVSGQGNAEGWYVALIGTAGKERRILHGTRGAPLAATLSRPVQQAAQAAVNTQRNPTMLVAIQPSTGDLLAVAQNPAAGREPQALNGLFPPGSTFKMATATAILEAGADTGTVVPCPGVATVGQRTVRNADSFALGDVPLRTAFAESCNTSFAMRAASLPPDALPRAADRLGLGADFVIPGITTEAGNVPAAGNTTEQVENSIGQGRVQASCFGITLMAATVAAGRATTPRLWRDLKTTVNTGYEAPPGAVVDSLRSMMRQVVTSGRGAALARYGDVAGKTGTAEVGGGAAHGWFAGYRGDLAFATLVLNSSTSTAAVDVTGTFLGGLG